MPGATGTPAASTTRTWVSGIARPEVEAITAGSSPRRHMVTIPLASESPYAVSTAAILSSDLSRSTSRRGTTAAPVTTSLSADRS